MITATETWTQENFSRGEAKGELEGELRAKITIIEGCLKANMSWDTITEATQIDQRSLQSMKNFYARTFGAFATDAEYIARRRVTIVYLLNFRFELSDEEQIAELDNLASVTEKDQLDNLVNSAVIVEDLDQFQDELLELIRLEESAEIA